MSSDTQDVDMLLTSPRASSVAGPSVEATSPPHSTLSTSPPRTKMCYVEVRKLTEEERENYATDLASRPLSYDDAFPEQEMESIIGELMVDSQSWYFVRLSDGQAFRFLAEDFADQHPRLVKDYIRKKARDELDPFDPAGPYIHPISRVDNRQDSVQYASDDADEFALGYEPSSMNEVEDSDPYEEDSDTPLHVRRSTRATVTGASRGKKQTYLPFSPKKTRSKKLPDYSAVLGDEDDDGEDPLALSSSSSPVPRRSTRASRKARAAPDGYDSDAYEDSPQPAKSKKRTQREKASRPAYGHFRNVRDLDYDSDPDTSALRAHRSGCAKCGAPPSHIIAGQLSKKKPKKKKRARREDDDLEESEDDNDRIERLGGWIRCLKCPVVAHWGCLAKTQRDEILKAALERERAEWLAGKPSDEDASDMERYARREPHKRPGLDIDQTTEFVCGSCMKGGHCYGCKEVALKPDSALITHGRSQSIAPETVSEGQDLEMRDASLGSVGSHISAKAPDELLFRCATCKRLAHYEHLPHPPDDPDGDYSAADLAQYYQQTNLWQCSDCVTFVYPLDQILAWRPYPADAVEPKLASGKVPDYKSPLPREYLVKWADRSFRRVQWVPHMWLLAASQAKLANFLKSGTSARLLPEPVGENDEEGAQMDDPVSTFGVGVDEVEDGEDGDIGSPDQDGTPAALFDAERRIPPTWKTVDRVLDVLLWRPEKRLSGIQKKSHKAQNRRTRRARIESESEDDDDEESELAIATREVEREQKACYECGEQPSSDLVETVEEWDKRMKKKMPIPANKVIWAFFKWHGLGYDNASWDSPPREGTLAYAAFEAAMERFNAARKVQVPIVSAKEIQTMDSLPKGMFRRKYAFTQDEQPQLGQSDQFKLMPFQVDGVNWLCDNWWNRQHCILADEMGLGKTVQIVTFVGAILQGFVDNYRVCPVLVVVPNSTITNWVREFERWAPQLRVVPFYGEAKSRDVIKRYELRHPTASKGTTGGKYHVLVTTYETLTNSKDVTDVFKNTPRWEAVVVDEGQRLKGDQNLLFRKLKELNTVHRIILTGTPLNNNIRELFNLMHFLDPTEWRDLKTLASEYEDLTEEKIKDLHNKLRPYFLRRVKSEVLQLPPKNEVIVPVSMTPLQKEVYRSLLSQNVQMLQSLALSATGTKLAANTKKTNLNNLLMQLRKCLQHPYLVSRDIEPEGLSSVQSHQKLVSASAKLVILQMLLPKLKARGHRVLLFSQFKIALDVIEDYLRGEGYKYLRLDGDIKQSDRQKDMDEFNKPDSDIFIYILSTRAGGVGINLWSADTVIIHDPDFNPHQDLQAIARSHRYGQQKTCLVFKLMVKDSAEERIMQNGKKKLVLDHLIVQKMDDEANEDVQSILTFGAQALFEEGGDKSARDIHYSDHDIDKLIEKTESEGEHHEAEASETAAFSFAKIWSADKDALEEIDDTNAVIQAQEDAWAQTLARIAEEQAQAKAQEATGRGTRRRVAPTNLKVVDTVDTPQKAKKVKGKGKGKVATSDEEDAYVNSDIESAGNTTGSTASDPIEMDLAAIAEPPKKKKKKSVLLDSLNRGPSPEPIVLYPARNSSTTERSEVCGLCGTSHPDRPCWMTERSENLAEYRSILMEHAGDETIEERRAAIAVIDQTLHNRGHMYLVYGQPLHPVERRQPATRPAQSIQIPSLPLPNGIAQTDGHKPKTPSAINGSGSFKHPAPDHGSARLNGGNSASPAIPRSAPPIPRFNITSHGAGPSKRTMSPPALAQPPLKKLKESGESSCSVCLQQPWHLIQDCPVVAEGSQSIAAEILRLQKDPSQATTVQILRRYLGDAKQREMRAAIANPPAT